MGGGGVLSTTNDVGHRARGFRKWGEGEGEGGGRPETGAAWDDGRSLWRECSTEPSTARHTGPLGGTSTVGTGGAGGGDLIWTTKRRTNINLWRILIFALGDLNSIYAKKFCDSNHPREKVFHLCDLFCGRHLCEGHAAEN